jgi:hypothetical protein
MTKFCEIADTEQGSLMQIRLCFVLLILSSFAWAQAPAVAHLTPATVVPAQKKNTMKTFILPAVFDAAATALDGYTTARGCPGKVEGNLWLYGGPQPSVHRTALVLAGNFALDNALAYLLRKNRFTRRFSFAPFAYSGAVHLWGGIDNLAACR